MLVASYGSLDLFTFAYMALLPNLMGLDLLELSEFEYAGDYCIVNCLFISINVALRVITI